MGKRITKNSPHADVFGMDSKYLRRYYGRLAFKERKSIFYRFCNSWFYPYLRGDVLHAIEEELDSKELEGKITSTQDLSGQESQSHRDVCVF